jgi:MOSC domain-containing protein YiiM
MTRFFYICVKEAAMHYPVNVFTGKVREYDGSRPSAIAKIQVDGELTLTDLGLRVMSRRKRKSTAGRTARCATIRANTISTGSEFPEQADLFCAPAFGENLSTEGLTEKTSLSAISSAGAMR